MKKILRPLLQFTLIAGISLALFELAVRLFLPTSLLMTNFVQTASWNDRLFFMSPGALVTREGFYNFKTDSTIREMAYYPASTSKLTQEYDCSYQSDSLGFLDNKIAYEQAGTLVLGDSFLQGQGGCAWVTALPDTIRDHTYFAGALGYGVHQWDAVLGFLEARKKVQKLVVIFIGEDFFRSKTLIPQFQFDCLSETISCGRGHKFLPINQYMDQIIAAHEYRRLKAPQPIEARMRAYYAGRQNEWGVKLLVDTLKGYYTMNEQAAEARAIVDRWASRYELTLIRVSTKDEAMNRHLPNAHSRLIRNYLSDYNPHECLLDADGYMPRDGHPNAKGYAQLRECVATLLGQAGNE